MTNTKNSDSFDQLNIDFSKYIRELQRKKAYLSIFLLVDQFISITKIFGLQSEEYLYFQNKYRSSELSDNDLTQTEIVMYLKDIIERLEKITHKTFKAEQLKKTSSDDWDDESDFTDIEKLKDDIAQFPDLVEIFKETLLNISESPKDTLNKPPEIKPIKKSPAISERKSVNKQKQPINNQNGKKKYTLTPIPTRPKTITYSIKKEQGKQKESNKLEKNDPDLMKILSDFDKKNKNTK